MAGLLLAASDRDLRSVYAAWLEEIDDVTLRTAPTGVEARERVDESVDVAVLDGRLPAVAGDDVTRLGRATHPGCTVVVVSAFDGDDGPSGSDYDRYLTKPIRRAELVTAVERELGLGAPSGG